MDKNIYKQVEQVVNRPINAMEYSYIENWQKLKYEDDYLLACIELARNQIAERKNVKYIDSIVFYYYKFYKTYKSLYGTFKQVDEVQTEAAAKSDYDLAMEELDKIW